IDLLILALLAFAILHGVRAGAAVQIASFAGLWGGLALGAALAPTTSRLVTGAGARALVAVVAVFGMSAALSAVGRQFSASIIARTRSRTVVKANAGLGAVVGRSEEHTSE